MEQELKIKIVGHAKKYAADNKLSQNEVARKADINSGYLSNMLRENFSTTVDGKDVPISDRWFFQLATATGFAVKKQYWSTVRTTEFEMIIHELTVAKNNSLVISVITDTGAGKTFSVDKFCIANPQHTYKITVNAMHRVKDILILISDALGYTSRFTGYHNFYVETLMGISQKLKELKLQGHQPLIIIDEAENLKLQQIQMLKGLYDYIIGYASIVLIGTTQLTDMLEKMKRKNMNGAPQFYRRIKAGIRVIPTQNDFAPFFTKFKIDDKELRKLLTELCSNYGELHDYLEPALRDADERGKPLTEDRFRIMYNMPKYK